MKLRRRELIALVGGLVSGWPLAARAEQKERVRRIGVLVSGPQSDPEHQALVRALRQGLERLGWMEGHNLLLEVRFAASAEEFQRIAKELVALEPDLILANTTPVVIAVQRESRTVPIVFTAVSDPIGSGFVANLARPGGQVTGFLYYEDGITGKWLAMLKEIAPHLARAAVIANPKNTPYDYFLRSAEAAAASLAIELVAYRVGDAADLRSAIESFAQMPEGGLVLLPDAMSITNRDLIIALAARHRLPAVYSQRLFVAAGGLMSYSTDRVDQFRQAATYVDRILRGEKAADLPVQTPVKYETVLNLKTARALGLNVPATVLTRADEVIE